MPAHTPPITTTFPLPSNEGCRHCFSLSKGFRQVWGGRKAQRAMEWDYGIPIRCVELFFVVLMMSPLLPPSSSTPSCLVAIANSTSVPVTGKPWVGSSTASNSTHPTIINDTPRRLSIRHVDQPQYPCPWPLAILWPWRRPRLRRAPHWQSCTVSTLHQRACSTSPMSTSHQAHQIRPS